MLSKITAVFLGPQVINIISDCILRVTGTREQTPQKQTGDGVSLSDRFSFVGLEKTPELGLFVQKI